MLTIRRFINFFVDCKFINTTNRPKNGLRKIDETKEKLMKESKEKLMEGFRDNQPIKDNKDCLYDKCKALYVCVWDIAKKQQYISPLSFV